LETKSIGFHLFGECNEGLREEISWTGVQTLDVKPEGAVVMRSRLDTAIPSGNRIDVNRLMCWMKYSFWHKSEYQKEKILEVHLLAKERA
jgi:hypothetical protein